MTSSTWRERADFGARMVMAAAWGIAGALKLADPAAFARDIGNYQITSALWAGVAAVYLPWLELALAAGLFFPRFIRAARLLSVALLGLFCAALISALARGLDIRCGCFGSAGAGASIGWALARNAVLIAALIHFGSPRGSGR